MEAVGISLFARNRFRIEADTNVVFRRRHCLHGAAFFDVQTTRALGERFGSYQRVAHCPSVLYSLGIVISGSAADLVIELRQEHFERVVADWAAECAFE